MKPKSEKMSEWQLARERFQISSAFPPKPLRPQKTIGEILSKIQNQESVSDTVPEMLQARWPAIVGKQIAQHTHPACLKGSRLIIYADHPGWLAETRRIPTQRLLKKISILPNAPPIKEMLFQLDPAIQTRPRWR